MTPELYHILLKNVILFSRPEQNALEELYDLEALSHRDSEKITV